MPDIDQTLLVFSQQDILLVLRNTEEVVRISMLYVVFLLIHFISSSVIAEENFLNHTKCLSEFIKYSPSPFELKWINNVNKWQENVCQHITNDEMQWWIGNVSYVMNLQDMSAVTTSAEKPPEMPWSYIFPTFTYRRNCIHKTDGSSKTDYVHIPIEPTAALARDPRKCWDPMSTEYTQSKEYLLPLSYKAATVSAIKLYNPHKTRQLQGSSAFLFDAGATVAGQAKAARTATKASWSGTEWIFEWYRKQGIVFDQVHAWEPTKHVVHTDNLDPDLVKALHFHNVGVTAGLSDQHNPLALIRKLCKQKDIVVFKLDIDNPMEMRLVRQLLNDPELLSLVDEFYYEHHVHNEVMRMHGLGGNDPRSNLKTWYDMVIPAREKGLHMHFWP